jgi:hypothetical protein
VPDGAATGIVGQGALLAALDRRRSATSATSSPPSSPSRTTSSAPSSPACSSSRAGPGTGKTVVALHRAAYLLYTYRFPLEGQGVLVVGPNRLYLRYIERVLPSLGEAGVELAVLADLVAEEVGDEREDPLAGRVKGDLRMVAVLAKAVRDRERPLREDLTVGFGVRTLRCSVDASDRIVRSARRRARTHNAGRKLVEQGLWDELAASARTELEPQVVRDRLRSEPSVREALERMWPSSARPTSSGTSSAPVPSSAWRRGTGSTTQSRRRSSDLGARPARSAGRAATCRCWTRRAPCSVPGPGPRTRRPCARTATSWSTRRRTSHPCSCGC